MLFRAFSRSARFQIGVASKLLGFVLLLPPSRSMASVSVVGVAQLKATNDKRHNLLEIAKCVGWAKQKNASMLFLPENCGFMGAAPGETLANAEPPLGQEEANDTTFTNMLEKMYQSSLEGKVCYEANETVEMDKSSTVSLVDGLRTLARASGLWISIGGMHVLGAPPAGDKTRFYNTHVILDDQGKVKAAYRKIHLFDVNIPDQGVNLMESNSTAAGKETVVCDSPVGMYHKGAIGIQMADSIFLPKWFVHPCSRLVSVFLIRHRPTRTVNVL